MFLIEAEGKDLLRRHGMAVPVGRLVDDPSEVGVPQTPVALKAQILAGGRGKAGLVRLAGAGEAQEVAREILSAAGPASPPLLVEEQVEIAAEYYLSWTVDDVAQKIALSFSTKGGIEVEENAGALRVLLVDPRKDVRPHHLLEFVAGSGVSGRLIGAVARFAARLFAVMRQEDALLIEINPLAVTAKGELVALDAKVTLDDNAAHRHTDWGKLRSRVVQLEAMAPLERRAAELGTTFVELDGSVALLTGGAGLGMAIVDMLSDEGLSPANFVDAPGGTTAETFGRQAALVFQRAAAPEVKAILLYLTLSATSLKQTVGGLTAFLERNPPPKPLVIGLAATGSSTREMSVEEAQQRFGALGYECCTELVEVVDRLKQVA